MKNQSCAELWNLWRITAVSPEFFLRYTDKDTLFYKLDEYGKYKHPGLGINILPLQCEYGPKGKYLWNRMRERWMERIYGKKWRVEEPA